MKKYYHPDDSWNTGGQLKYKVEPTIRYADVLLWYAEALNELVSGQTYQIPSYNEIPGTEDLMPYISKADKQKKWLFGTVGMAVISLLLAGLGLLL